MAKVFKLCSCGNSSFAHVGQSFRSGGLSWYLSFRCPYCGIANEVDGKEDIPFEIRNAILEQEGKWGLFINDGENSTSSVLLILRKELNLPLNEVARIRKLIPGIVVSGTEFEMERLKKVLSVNNMHISVLKLED